MAQDFNEILSSMLKDLDNGKSVEEIIAAKMAEMGLSEESQANVIETVDYVDQIEDADKSLQRAIDNGASRQEWLDDHVDALVDALPEEQQEIAQKIVDDIVERDLDGLQQEEE